MEGKPMDDLLFFFFLSAASPSIWTVEDMNIKAVHALRALNPGQVQYPSGLELLEGGQRHN